jgi:aspartyl-tRNA(Asn)/glutamyl-tRNA(Gln) amidotransferase subunit C
MQVDDALINKLSRLAMLDFDEHEREEIKADLEKMIGFVDKLRELDTSGVEPLLHITSEVNVLREDIPGNMLRKEDALKNAPLHNEDFFLVPKVIKKGES